MRLTRISFALLAATVAFTFPLSPPAHAGIVVSVEAAGAQTSTVAGVTTETFNSFSPGQYSSLSTNIGTLSSTGQFSIVAADIYGGAGGIGDYFAVGAQSGSASPVTLTLNGPESYFGMWWSAADANNTVQLYSGSTLEGTYTTSSIFSGLPGSYYGNPNNGGDTGEPFAYVNFTGDPGTTITSVVFSNSGSTGTGFESDNFSVAGVGIVPEPSSIVLVGTGAALLGLAAWRRRRNQRYARATSERLGERN